MKRRNFLKTAPVLSLPLLIKGFPVEAMTETPLLHLLGQQSLVNGRVLVLVQLNGGNDGLNTVIPLDRYKELTIARSNILIPTANVLPLNNSVATGLHPSMTEMQGLYNAGLMNIVQSVSYPTPSFSHFRATDIWLTAANNAKNEYLTTGWIGRSIDSEYPDYPDTSTDYPLAVQIGSQASAITQASQTNAAFTVTDPANFTTLLSTPVPSTATTPYGIELDFLRGIQLSTNKYATIVKTANSKGTNLSTKYPTANTNSLADQLKIVARLIKGGLQTPVYIVNHPNSFDTHSNQLVAQANALGVLSKAIGAFQDDLGLLGIQHRVTGMTFTEFGRRIVSNTTSSPGTDHGTSIPMFFFGSKLNPGINGTSPVLPASPGVNDQLPMQFDFRAVYYTVLKDWFQLTDVELTSVLSTPYTTVPIFKQAALPVNILSFTGDWKNAQVSLDWAVDQESNIDSYEVQRSEDGITFYKLGIVNALNVTSRHDYKYYDSSLVRSSYYYRIKSIEKSGTITYTGILLLKDAQQTNGVRVKVFPNPIDNWFVTAFQDKVSGNITARMLDLSGQEVWKSEQVANDTYNLSFKINKYVTPGVYVIQIRDNNNEASVKVLLR